MKTTISPKLPSTNYVPFCLTLKAICLEDIIIDHMSFYFAVLMQFQINHHISWIYNHLKKINIFNNVSKPLNGLWPKAIFYHLNFMMYQFFCNRRNWARSCVVVANISININAKRILLCAGKYVLIQNWKAD